MTCLRSFNYIYKTYSCCGSVSSETGNDYVVDDDDNCMEDNGVDGGGNRRNSWSGLFEG